MSDLKLDTRLSQDLVMKLMAIPGKGGNEAGVADFIRKTLIKAGANSQDFDTDKAYLRTPIKGNTGNLVFKMAGTNRGPRRMLSAHMDTVPICVGSKPVLKNGMVTSANPGTGLGADDRAGCAVLLSTALHLLKYKPDHPPLTFCWFIQEEGGLHGAKNVRKSMLGAPKLAFNFDGGACDKLTIGATGGYRAVVEIRGIASHAGGAPELGVSAIAIASLAIADLHNNGWHGDIIKGKKHGTSNVGFIQGGEATNVVTDFVQLKVEARSHDAKFRKKILDEIEKAFRKAAKQVKNVHGICGEIEFSSNLDYESFALSKSEPSVKAAAAAVRAVGREPSFAIANGGLDANWLTAHGIPTVSLGCGQLNQHMVTEMLDMEEYQAACAVGLELALANAAS